MPSNPYTELAELAGGFIHDVKNRLSTVNLNLGLNSYQLWLIGNAKINHFNAVFARQMLFANGFKILPGGNGFHGLTGHVKPQDPRLLRWGALRLRLLSLAVFDVVIKGLQVIWNGKNSSCFHFKHGEGSLVGYWRVC